MAVLLSHLTVELRGRLVGQPDLPITGIASLQEATQGCISFISQDRYRHLLKDFKGSALIVGEALAAFVPAHVSALVVDDPYLAYARLTQFWRRQHPRPHSPRIHPSAVIHPDAWLDSDVEVGPLSVIEAGVRVGAGTRILSRVTVMADVIMGERCVLHPGVVVGADGFGFARQEAGWTKIEQLGNVVLGDGVELGANTCVDRAALGSTVLGEGVKIDNLVQIGHNVQIGAHTAMAGCVGVAGSAKIGARCTFGGGAIVLGHLEVSDDVHVSAASVVTKSIKTAGQYSGLFPLDDNAAWEKNAASLKQLHALRERIKHLESHLQKKASS